MQRNRFGASDLEVSRIGFGCARIGGMGAAGPNRTRSIRLLHEAVERGINFFDTADAYAEGDSERLLGEAFQHRRHEVVIATKVGYVFSDKPITTGRLQPAVRVLRRVRSKLSSRLLGRGGRFEQQDFSPAYLVRAVEASLRRLRTDYIDVYQLHAPRGTKVERADAIDTLFRLRESGKIRHVGVGLETLYSADQWLAYPELGSMQLPFGLLDLEAHEVLPQVAQHGAALIARGAYGGGLLKAGHDLQWLREHTAKSARIGQFHRIAADANRSIYSLALQYVLQEPEVSVVLLGMHTQAQLEGNLKCANESPLDTATLAAIGEVNARVPLVHP